MKEKKKAVGLALLCFGAGVLANIIFPCIGFIIGVLMIALGILEFCC